MEVAISCLFLACKVEETPKKIQSVLMSAKHVMEEQFVKSLGQAAFAREDAGRMQLGIQLGVTLDVKSSDYCLLKDRILLLERILLHTISFDLDIVHPYKILVEEMKKFGNKFAAGGLWKSVGDKKKIHLQEVAQLSICLVNDTYMTTLCLTFPPDVIARCAIVLALNLLKVQIVDKKSWTEVLNVDDQDLIIVAKFLNALRSSDYCDILNIKK